MADTAIFGLGQETALTAAHRLVVQDTSAATLSQSATFALMGGLEVTTGSDADTTMAVGTLYRVDMSAWATAVRTYRLPSTAAVGERIGIYITAGNATHELAIRTVAASNDTINGVDYDSADWSKLFITGEIVIFECVVANTDWIVLHDGRLPCSAFCYLSSIDTNGAANGNWSGVTIDTDLFDQGDISDLTNDRFALRRDGLYLASGQVTLNSVADQVAVQIRVQNDTDAVRVAKVSQETSHTSTAEGPAAITVPFRASDGDAIGFDVYQASGGNLDIGGHASNRPTWASIIEILPNALSGTYT